MYHSLRRIGAAFLCFGLLLTGLFWTGLGSEAAEGRASPGRPAPAAAPDGAIDFVRDVRPVLAARCFACHGERVQQNGLRLDRRERALEGGDSGPAIVPGRSAESELVRRLLAADPKQSMPPGKPLPAGEIRVLREWIDQGAPWPEAAAPRTTASAEHWAFRPVSRPGVPPVRLRGWVVTPIDAFILARLEREGLRPSPPADRATLIRRLSLDLTGLLPSPEEVDAFLADRRPGAYERLVDRLLASPHYGERWGRHWLDQARYADSNGYTIDSARSMWPYRDWVIDALNRDLPFDRFTIEQLAGDMLPGATQAQVIATGFHRNTLINEEGGTDREQFRVESVVDRVNTTGAVWLGLTLGCAQCHTHKYDPITQREYYQLYAFLNNADEPALPLPTPEQASRQESLKSEVAAASRRLDDYDRGQPARQAAWERGLAGASAAAWRVIEPGEARSSGGATLRRLQDGSLLAGGAIPDNDDYSVETDAPPGPITAIRLEALTHPEIAGSGPGLTPHGNFVLSEFEVAALLPPGSGADAARPVKLAAAHADYAQPALPVSAAIDGNPTTGWGVYAANSHVSRTAVFLPESPLAAGAGVRLRFTLKHRYTGARYQIGRFRLSVSSAPPALLDAALPEAARAVLAIPAERRTREQREALSTEFRQRDPERVRLAAALEELQKTEKDLERAMPSTLVMKERESPRETFVQIRGDFLRRGARVRPGVPEVLPRLDTGSREPNRLDLARWLVDPANPLTPRVTVNRFWQAYFGTGLVETDNDFGRQGTPPSHPELLDWLASVFSAPRSSGPGGGLGWSMKSLHRMLVLSATYRQSSAHRPEIRDVDPANRLLARQSRLRLEAEVLRDVALAAGGLLSLKMGGPSVYPPQPAGLDLFTQNRKNWKPSEGEDRYRRGIYTFFWRSSPYALFQTFDAPNANVTCTRRGRSNTPLGALMLANDASMFEAAQALGARLAGHGDPSPEARVREGFRRCLAREPSAAEAGRLLAFYRAQEAAYAAAPREAAAAAPALAAGMDAARGAAWTAVARVLLNLDEFITRE